MAPGPALISGNSLQLLRNLWSDGLQAVTSVFASVITSVSVPEASSPVVCISRGLARSPLGRWLNLRRGLDFCTKMLELLVLRDELPRAALA